MSCAGYYRVGKSKTKPILMKSILLVFSVFLFADSLVIAQDYAYLKVVNAVNLESPTYISINGNKFRRGEPIPAGQASGALTLPPGSYTLKVENESAEKKQRIATVELLPNSTNGVVFFAEVEVKEDQDGNPVEKHRLNHTLLTGKDKVGKPKLTVFSLTKEEQVDFQIKGRPYRFQRKKPFVIPVNRGQIVKIETSKDRIEVGAIPIESLFHYVAFIYSNTGEKPYRLVVYEHRSYVDDFKFEEGGEEVSE